MLKRGSIYLAKLYPSKAHEVGKNKTCISDSLNITSLNEKELYKVQQRVEILLDFNL